MFDPLNHRQVRVGIGQYWYASTDGGESWERCLREIPGSKTPIVHGPVNLSRMPALNEPAFWDSVKVLPNGFGIAAGHALLPDRGPTEAQKRALVYITDDGGSSWMEALMHSWPVEEFQSLVVPADNLCALAWRDPWLDDLFSNGPQSHILCSNDCGKTWEYECLGEHNPFLTADYSGRLFVCNDGYFLESVDGARPWTRRNFSVQWPPQYNRRKTALLRHVTFVDSSVAFALLVHWGQNMSAEPPEIGFVTTNDVGRTWSHVSVFPGLNFGDVNARHALALEIGRCSNPHIREVKQ